MIARIDCLTSIPLPAPTKLSREATNENEFLGLMMHVERMQLHLRNQECVNTYFISKLTLFAMHMMTQEKSAMSLISEWLFQLMVYTTGDSQTVFAYMPHEHTSPHSNKALERSNK